MTEQESYYLVRFVKTLNRLCLVQKYDELDLLTDITWTNNGPTWVK